MECHTMPVDLTSEQNTQQVEMFERKRLYFTAH